MRALCFTANIFANHLYHFGDTHWTKSIGPERARRMDACKDALEIFDGCFAINSDVPVTPMVPLFTAWCAVNRKTQSGRDLGNSQKISAEQGTSCDNNGGSICIENGWSNWIYFSRKTSWLWRFRGGPNKCSPPKIERCLCNWDNIGRRIYNALRPLTKSRNLGNWF